MNESIDSVSKNDYNLRIGVMNLENLNNFNELPLTLNVQDVARALGISKQSAYTLCHSKGFPCVKIGRRMIIPRPAFIKWMENPHM